ncbi:MAG: LPS assembly lipoprotein LptE [Pseudomonadota bacterium]
MARDVTLNRRQVAVGLGLAGLLTGCNLRPLHGSQQAAVTQELSTTRVAPLSNRLGQKLHNLLLNRINPRGQPSQPDYELRVALSRSQRESGLREDETATRITLTLTADYQLVALQDQSTVTRGTTGAQAVFNILENRFASQVSEQSAEERALVIIADAISTRLTAALS